MPQEAQLKVAKAYPNDSGRGIARLDPDTLLKLQLSPGEIIEIVGKTNRRKSLAGRSSGLARGHHTDRRFHSSNRPGVGMGERVLVRKPKVNEAQKVVLAPPEGSVAQPLAEMTESVHRQLLKRPMVQGDVVPIMSVASHPLLRVPGQAVPLSSSIRVRWA